MTADTSLLESLPVSLTEFTIFEEVMDGFSFGHLTLDVEQQPRVSLGLSLARMSQRLQHFSASFAIDARHFFQPFSREASTTSVEVADDWVWAKLETLALTSKLLTSPRQSEEDINHLLEAASLAVRRMPRLHTMEIWNGNGDEHACLFRYSYDPDSRTASLTWKGTWTIGITRRTARSWRRTVRQRTGVAAEIQIEEIYIPRPFMTEAVARLLYLRDRVATKRVSRFLPLC